MQFEWDENKNQLNQQKHGISFGSSGFKGISKTNEKDRLII